MGRQSALLFTGPPNFRVLLLARERVLFAHLTTRMFIWSLALEWRGRRVQEAPQTNHFLNGLRRKKKNKAEANNTQVVRCLSHNYERTLTEHCYLRNGCERERSQIAHGIIQFWFPAQEMSSIFLINCTQRWVMVKNFCVRQFVPNFENFLMAFSAEFQSSLWLIFGVIIIAPFLLPVRC